MVTGFDRENLAQNLPDAYQKGSASTNARILEIEKRSMDVLRASIQAAYDSLDLDLATGATLDMYGDMIGQKRGSATDEQYRAMLKGKITRNLAGGDFNSIIGAICMTFGCSPSEIALVETDEPCTVRIEGLPFESINTSGLGADAAVQIVARLIPAGVFIESMAFDGSFEFGDTSLEYDEGAGFGNIEQTIGGQFGYIATGAATLPI